MGICKSKNADELSDIQSNAYSEGTNKRDSTFKQKKAG